MKANIHPKWYPEATVTCACGKMYVIGLTVPSLSIDVCANCHPFYTGQMRYVDVAGRVDKFKARVASAGKKILSKTEKRRVKRLKRIEEELERPASLEELRNG
ncbi:50S ribosomal protein L31 [Candidatus Woesebacteria bacterium RIFCSPHIGHO2_02_FULL_38_9]|uniref:50S ribosomal protein L31 n=1 Tax=Candidatus Woesebacteria bacterium RIFCSPHIGHO2_01_FULL_39_28 TaxID=1802496 RepID=A0A1F7YGJ7_9BACT|nr:MAG: 50S ribosomal protein L31 [Candidatus Woesebacteria bacterium RIFCSPHIGHO2_01_FULL_39_28]OGM32260.1 MAG: 50S ribosomal protein L31 [Candidatus Woesebacteria bacterium RIFCSPHIGHO2_02_FULL_38_9]OGM56861.1 MAG: 50S ribosomal protein L31 [Candidatus Woesebacteria bacterium RIFCSPLOWO2_01_FULL_38_20]